MLAMDKVRVLILVLVLVLMSSFRVTKGEDEEQGKKASLWEWQRLRSAYSTYEALFPTTIGHFWYMLKTLLNQAYARFFPPNIDFRRGDEGEAAMVAENGAGEKVKEALAKSLGSSKATMEDAAKSAANIAGETMQKAKEKVKRSLSEDGETKRQNEL